MYNSFHNNTTHYSLYDIEQLVKYVPHHFLSYFEALSRQKGSPKSLYSTYNNPA
jgi:CRISPR/Cas system CSM-associated protein Csm5 (group 7 of RAMP superfamily)